MLKKATKMIVMMLKENVNIEDQVQAFRPHLNQDPRYFRHQKLTTHIFSEKFMMFLGFICLLGGVPFAATFFQSKLPKYIARHSVVAPASLLRFFGKCKHYCIYFSRHVMFLHYICTIISISAVTLFHALFFNQVCSISPDNNDGTSLLANSSQHFQPNVSVKDAIQIRFSIFFQFY